MKTEIRKITHEERRDSWKLRLYLFNDWTGENIPESDFADTMPDYTYGVFEDGNLMSMIRNYKVSQSIRGVMKPANGIASVGTYPQARRKGYVKSLMKASFDFMGEHKQCLSLLVPFKESFYERFGYVPANNFITVKAPLHSIKHYMLKEDQPDWTYEIKQAKDYKDEYINFASNIAPSIHGYCIYELVGNGEWEKASKGNLIVFVKKSGKIRALAKFTKQGFKQSGEILVNDMLWIDREARDKLLNFFARHTEQIEHITLPIRHCESINHYIKDAMVPLKISYPPNTWMVRVCDFEQAIEGIPCGINDLDISINISDEYCENNNGTFRLTAKNGTLKAKRENNTNNPSVSFEIKGLSAWVYGTLPIEEIIHRGWGYIKDNDINTGTFGKILPPQPIYIPQDFMVFYL